MCKALAKRKHSKGNTLIELMIVMAMLGLLGAVLLSLISTGSTAFQRVNKTHDAQLEARLALSYVVVKIRQNDVTGMIHVDNSHQLTITNPKDTDESWIIQESSNKLVEQFDDSSGVTPLPETVIAEGVTFEVDDDLVNGARRITVEVGYGTGKKLKETITLRSDVATP